MSVILLFFTTLQNLLFLLAGMTLFPHVDVAHGFDIAFNASDRSSWRKYTKALEAHLKRK